MEIGDFKKEKKSKVTSIRLKPSTFKILKENKIDISKVVNAQLSKIEKQVQTKQGKPNQDKTTQSKSK